MTTEPVFPPPPDQERAPPSWWRRNTARLIAVAVLVAVAVAVVVIVTAARTTPTALSAACRKAQTAEFAYARWVGQNTSYPNDSLDVDQPIFFHYGALIHAMGKVCPGTAKTLSLPGG